MENLPDYENRRLAVTTFDKNIVVTAGAGTGKTTLLVDRIICLLMRPQDPLKLTDIVALTFTNKAAGEMRGYLLGAPDSAEEGMTGFEVRKLAFNSGKDSWRPATPARSGWASSALA